MPHWLLYLAIGLVVVFSINCLINATRKDGSWFDFILFETIAEGLSSVLILLLEMF